jgi:hypothetical protein
MDTAYGRIMPSIPADRQLSIKPRLPDYPLKLSFDSVVSGDQEYGYPLLPALSGGILRTLLSVGCSEFGTSRYYLAMRNLAAIGGTADIDQAAPATKPLVPKWDYGRVGS